MKRHPADILSADLKAQITSDISYLLSDAQVASSVTVKTPTGVTMTASTGSSVLTFTTDTVNGTLQALTQSEIASSGNFYQQNDRMLRMASANLSIAPTIDTQIVSGSDTYQVISADLDILGLMWVLVIRRNP